MRKWKVLAEYMPFWGVPLLRVTRDAGLCRMQFYVGDSANVTCISY